MSNVSRSISFSEFYTFISLLLLKLIIYLTTFTNNNRYLLVATGFYFFLTHSHKFYTFTYYYVK